MSSTNPTSLLNSDPISSNNNDQTNLSPSINNLKENNNILSENQPNIIVKKQKISEEISLQKLYEIPYIFLPNYNENPSIQKHFCTYCNKDITYNVKFLCSKCGIYYCIHCFLNKKHSEHEYHIVDTLKFPIFTKDWKLNDEFSLLNAISKCGLDNWEDISDLMRNRGNIECESHYYSFYYKDDKNLIPNESDIILTSDKKINEEILEKNNKIDNLKKENLEKYNNSNFIETNLNEKANNIKKRNSRTTKNSNRNSNGINSAEEIVGYWPKRDEFDIEFLNDAELELAELDFYDDENEDYKKIKFDVLTAYNYQLDEREIRRKFLIEKGLLNLKRQNNIECKLNKEDREILNFIKFTARFFKQSEFYDLFEGLILEKNLKQKINQLRNFQKIDKNKNEKLSSLDDIGKYIEIDKNIKNKKKENEDKILNNKLNNSLGERLQRFFNYQNVLEEKENENKKNENNNENNENKNEKKNENNENNENKNKNDENKNENENEIIEYKIFEKDEYDFIKEKPLAISTFYDIKLNINKIFKDYKNENKNKENIKKDLEEIINKYDLEITMHNEILDFYFNKYVKLFDIKEEIKENNNEI